MYTRVFTAILDSSLNCTDVPPEARWLWLTMLLIADEQRTGVVDMPLERLAARAGLTIDQTRTGLAVLQAPDPQSRSEDSEGRRLLPINSNGRGWELVNWSKYRQIAIAEHNREQTRQRVRKHREKQAGITGNGVVTNSNEKFAPEASPSPKHLIPPPTPPEPETPVPEPPKAKRPAFKPPSVDEVQARIDEKGYDFNALEFVAHHQARGWIYKTGQPMKDWRAALLTWQLNREKGAFR